MSAFTDEFSSENVSGGSNIPFVLASPKGSVKDFSVIAPGSAGSFTLGSPNYSLEASTPALNASEGDIEEVNVVDLTESQGLPSEQEETLEERLAREERESQELAWQLMQQDNIDMCNMQMQFMQENADHLSEEDMLLMQALVRESGVPIAPGPAVAEGEAEGEEEEGEELDESDSSNWDYERLLQLGQQLGDVKTERWRMRSKNVIASLPRRLYSAILAERRPSTAAPAAPSEPVTVFQLPCASPSSTTTNGSGEKEASSSNKKQCIRPDGCPCSGDKTAETATTVVGMGTDSERCVVCMDDYQPDEELVVFPCKHYFHVPCTEGWLADHNSCPSCKQKVVASPEK